VISQEAFLSSVGSALPTTAARQELHGFWLQDWWVFVKGWHATEFAILFLLIRRAVGDLGWSLFLTMLAAVLDEFHQTFVPGRGGKLSDVLIDVGGAMFVAIIVAWRSAPRPSKNALPSAT
jgi:hypothetical protein